MLGRRQGRLFDVTVFALGTVWAAVLALPWLDSGAPVPVAALVTAACVVLLAQYPIELPSRAGDVVIGFEAAALVFLSLTVDRAQALALWLLATTVAHGVAQRKRWNDRLFNIGVTSLSGVVLVLFVESSRAHGGAAQFAAVAAGCAAYFLLDLVVTGLSLAVSEATRLREALPLRSAVMPLACFVGVDTVGYLGALIYHGYGSTQLVLLVVPLITIVVAARAVARAKDSGRRTESLFAIAQAASTLDEATDIVALLVDRLQELLPHRRVELRPTGPDADEVGAALTAGTGGPAFVVVGQSATGQPLRETERQTVKTLVAVANESLDRQRLVAATTRMARVDPLTGLANRPVLLDRLAHAVELSRRGQGMVALLYCDLDGFKGVNDRYGHDTGDQVLAAVAERLRGALRAVDTPARLGGDEFAVLAEGLRNEHEAMTVGRRLVDALHEPLLVGGHRVRLGVSVGVAVSGGELDADALLRAADMAMYRAKAAGRNRAEFFDPEMRRQSERRLQMEDELRIALDRDLLELAVQPIVELSTGRVDGFEALLRWNSERLGPVPPDVVLPVAEQMGLVPRLGRWVLHEAHRQGVVLSAAAGRQVTMAVNVAAEQLHDEQFLADAERLAEDPRVHLVVELTERALVDEDVADRALHRLHDAGAGIAIDDFGIGYSSIGYLHRFDCIDIVKVDRSFVRGVAIDPRTRALVESVIAMAEAFEAVVVAEGIEDWSTMATLRASGCRLGQGYLFDRPVRLDVAARVANRGAYDLAPVLALPSQRAPEREVLEL